MLLTNETTVQYLNQVSYLNKLGNRSALKQTVDYYKNICAWSQPLVLFNEEFNESNQVSPETVKSAIAKLTSAYTELLK